MLISASLIAYAQSPTQRGATVFNESGCIHCHAIRGAGGSKGPDLSSVGRSLKKDAMRKQILDGGPQMPPFNGILNDQELTNLLAYLHSCKDKKKGN